MKKKEYKILWKGGGRGVMCRLKNVNNTQIYMHMNLNFVIDSFALIFAALTLDFYLSFGLDNSAVN